MSDIIWSPGTRVGPGWSDSSNSVPFVSNGSNSIGVSSSAREYDNESFGSGLGTINYNNGVDTNFNDFEDIFKGVAGWIQNLFSGSAQGVNNSNYMKLMEMQNDYNTNSAKMAMKFSNEQVERQMAFQQYNADTQYQRAVEDLKKAGLNPALAVFGSGAGMPSGASASGIAHTSATPGYDDGNNGLTSIVQSFVSNLPLLSIASALNGTKNMSKLIKNVTGIVDGIAGFVNNIVAGFNGDYKGKWNGNNYELPW